MSLIGVRLNVNNYNQTLLIGLRRCECPLNRCDIQPWTKPVNPDFTTKSSAAAGRSDLGVKEWECNHQNRVNWRDFGAFLHAVMLLIWNGSKKRWFPIDSKVNELHEGEQQQMKTNSDMTRHDPHEPVADERFEWCGCGVEQPNSKTKGDSTLRCRANRLSRFFS